MAQIAILAYSLYFTLVIADPWNITLPYHSPMISYFPRGDSSVDTGWAIWSSDLNDASPGNETAARTSYRTTSLPTASFSFGFRGSALTIYGTADIAYLVSLDDQKSHLSVSFPFGVLYAASGLSPGQHWVSVEVGNTSQTSQSITFDYALYTISSSEQLTQLTYDIQQPSDTNDCSQQTSGPAEFLSTEMDNHLSITSMSFSGAHAVTINASLSSGYVDYTVELDTATYSFNSSTRSAIDNTVLFFESHLDPDVRHDIRIARTVKSEDNLSLLSFSLWQPVPGSQTNVALKETSQNIHNLNRRVVVRDTNVNWNQNNGNGNGNNINSDGNNVNDGTGGVAHIPQPTSTTQSNNGSPTRSASDGTGTSGESITASGTGKSGAQVHNLSPGVIIAITLAATLLLAVVIGAMLYFLFARGSARRPPREIQNIDGSPAGSHPAGFHSLRSSPNLAPIAVPFPPAESVTGMSMGSASNSTGQGITPYGEVATGRAYKDVRQQIDIEAEAGANANVGSRPAIIVEQEAVDRIIAMITQRLDQLLTANNGPHLPPSYPSSATRLDQ